MRTSYLGRTVADVMRSAATMVEAHGHLAAGAYLMKQADQSALVVVDDAERPVAIITERDMLRAVAHGADAAEERISDWMNPDPRTVDPNATVTEAARIMRDAAVRQLPVVSDGRVVGMVAINDILRTLVGSARLTSVVLSVRDLARSLAFYRPLLHYPVTAEDTGAALLTGPDGSQLYLHQTGADGASGPDDRARVETVVWTADGPDGLDRCVRLLRKHGTYLGRGTDAGIARVTGRDPDGIPTVMAYPGPDQAPRHTMALFRDPIPPAAP